VVALGWLRGEIGAVSGAVVATKLCSRCKVVLPREMFARHAGTKHGLQVWCRACQNAHQRGRYASDPEYRKKVIAQACELTRKRYASDPVYREKVIARACERARKRRDVAVGCATQAREGPVPPSFSQIW
jgi:hypothetical protein